MNLMNQESLMRMKLRARGYRFTFSYGIVEENKVLLQQISNMTKMVNVLADQRKEDNKLIIDLDTQLRAYELKEKHETT